ncbi:MAG: hypothetical protein F4015_01315 [Acidimicrobiia bacterium]|nr:hypothetical protein [Acidimicrobiia bacterium]MYL08135.1 hypothetical protein [Acidimicrobiia bacterium]
MTWTIWPAGVLGPVVGWIRFSISTPLLAVAITVLKGAWSQPQTWAILAACGAVLAVSFAKIRSRRSVYATLNLMFAVMLVLWAEFWHSMAGPWWAALAGLTSGVLLVVSDALARWALSRLAANDSGGCGVSARVEIGVLWGFVDASTPTVMGLNDGSQVRLSLGYRYVWWLGTESKEPLELLMAIDRGSDFSAN